MKFLAVFALVGAAMASTQNPGVYAYGKKAQAPSNMASIGFESFVPIGSGVRNASFGFRSAHGKDAPATTTTAVGGTKEEAKVCIDVAKTVCKEPSKNAANDHTIKPSYVGSLTDKTATICAGDSCPPETKAALKAYDTQLSKVNHEKNVVAEIKGLIQVYTKKQGEVAKQLSKEQAALAKAKAAITASKSAAAISGTKAKMGKTQQLNNELAGHLQNLKHLAQRHTKLQSKADAIKAAKDRATAQVDEIKKKLAALKL